MCLSSKGQHKSALCSEVFDRRVRLTQCNVQWDQLASTGQWDQQVNCFCRRRKRLSVLRFKLRQDPTEASVADNTCTR